MTKSATERQINWIADLLAKKAWNDEAAVAPKFITRAAVINLAISWAKDPGAMGAAVSDVATAAEVGQRVNQILAHGGTGADDPAAWAPFTVQGASKMIDWLRALPFKADAPVPAPAPAPAPAPKAERVELEDGMYMIDGTFYKVQHSLNGSRQYAKIGRMSKNKDGKDAVKFSYAPGAIARIRPEHKLGYEQAKEFGALYGTCCCCGRTLSNELSIHLGIGPVCGNREFGGDFKQIIDLAKVKLAS